MWDVTVVVKLFGVARLWGCGVVVVDWYLGWKW